MILLLIDDSPVEKMAFERMLKKTGLVREVRTASDVPERGDPIMDGVSLVFLDLSLNRTDGVETVKEFSDHFPLAVFIVLTGNTSPEIKRECEIYGANCVLAKRTGMTTENFAHAIEQAAESAEMTRAMLGEFRAVVKKLKEMAQK